MGKNNNINEDFVQLARMAVNEQWDDVRLFVARVLRRYRADSPEFSKALNELLKSNPARKSGIFRNQMTDYGAEAAAVEPGVGSGLLRSFVEEEIPAPLLSTQTRQEIDQLILERRRADFLIGAGLSPSRSAIFEGPPGVGKTLTARWIASQIKKPLLILDLATVMSSYLGRTGTNVRAAIEYAKEQDAVLLLDEIDAIAKRRSDDADIGELKRLVTVVMQEVDAWPQTNFLLAATNHPELIDPALWRRFDSVIHFGLPEESQIKEALIRYLGRDKDKFKGWIESLAIAAEGESFSNLEKSINRMRRSLALGLADTDSLAADYLSKRVKSLDKKSKISVASHLFTATDLSQHQVSEVTGVARETIRKYAIVKADQG